MRPIDPVRQRAGRARIGRRPILGLIAGLPWLAGGAVARAAAQAFPDGINLLAAGPEGGHLADWARRLAPLLRAALPEGAEPRVSLAGAADGVTGANRFHATAQPDGATALIVPGAATLAWLAGDKRAHYDPSAWLGLLAATGPAVVVSRVGPEGLARGMKPRVGFGVPHGPDMAGVLGLELMGLDPVAVPIPATNDGADAMLSAFARQRIDMMLLHGRALADRLALAVQSGGVPLCSLGMADAAAGTLRDPALAELPHVAELAGALGLGWPTGPLAAGWEALAASARLGFALVLPALIPAALAVLWRQAAETVAADPTLRAAVTASGLRLEAGSRAMAVDPEALLALRGWMAARVGWKPE